MLSRETGSALMKQTLLGRPRRSQQERGRMERKKSKRECRRFHGGDAVVLKPERAPLDKTDGGEGIWPSKNGPVLPAALTLSYHQFSF